MLLKPVMCRPVVLEGWTDFALELLICCIQPLLFRPISHTNFRLMRGSFYYSCASSVWLRGSSCNALVCTWPCSPALGRDIGSWPLTVLHLCNRQAVSMINHQRAQAAICQVYKVKYYLAYAECCATERLNRVLVHVQALHWPQV